MSNWLKTAWGFTDNAVQRSAAWLALAIALGIYGAAVTVVSWLTRSITFLAQYGWGLPILAAIAFVSVIVIAMLRFAAVPAAEAWRKFRPLPETKTDRGVALSAKPETAADSAPWKADIESLGSAVEGYIDTTSSALRKDIAELTDTLKGAPWNADIIRLNELGVSQHGINDDLRGKVSHQAGAQAVILADLRNLERTFGYLIDAIHARDAEIRIKQADALIDPLGRKLLAANGYSGPKEWLADYRSWRDSVTAIDRTILNQKVEGFTPYLDIRARDLEKCSETPPDELKADGRVVVAYKTVFLAQRRYMLGREQVFRFFSTKAGLPG